MKTRNYGVSQLPRLIAPQTTPNPAINTSLCPQAVNNYRESRENGDEKDNPSYEFPNDGQYTWETPNASQSKVKYTEGLKDKAWMEEKDRNYVRRIAREGTIEEKSQLAKFLPLYEQELMQEIQNKARIEADKIKKTERDQIAAKKFDAGGNVYIKKLTFGVSESVSGYSGLNTTVDALPKTTDYLSMKYQALKHYRTNRESGKLQDDPPRDFPCDGKYTWATPNASMSPVRYTEGIQDKAWMEEKDRNYLTRLTCEETVTEETKKTAVCETIQISDKMKNQVFGLSRGKYKIDTKRYSDDDAHISDARQSYRIGRENGTITDNPLWPFPGDGEYIWEEPNEQYSKVLYTAGKKDKTWMDEKDHNYLARLTREKKAAEEKEIQRITLITQVEKLTQQLQEKDNENQSLKKTIQDLQIRYEQENLKNRLENIQEQQSEFQQKLEEAWYQLNRKIESREKKYCDQVQKVENTINTLKENESENKEKIQKHEEELKTLHLNQEKLMREDRTKQELSVQQQEISRTPELFPFYRCIQMKLTEIFLAMKTIASKMIDAPVSLEESCFRKAIKLSGETIDILGAPAVAGLTTGIMEFFSQSRAQTRIKRQSACISTFDDIKTIAESVARKTTQRYTEQLLQLIPEESKLLGVCAIRRMSYYLEHHLRSLLSGESSPEQTRIAFVQQLVSSLYKVDKRLEFLGFKNKTITKIQLKVGELKWTDRGIFMESGIRFRCYSQESSENLEERYYDGDIQIYFNRNDDLQAKPDVESHLRPDKYGYRLGTPDETKNLTKSDKRIPSEMSQRMVARMKESEQENQELRELIKEQDEQKNDLMDPLIRRDDIQQVDSEEIIIETISVQHIEGPMTHFAQSSKIEEQQKQQQSQQRPPGP